MEHVKVFLFDKSGEVQYGLNWGQRDGREKNQAYLQLEPDVYKTAYFPPKGKFFIVKTDDGQTIIFNRAQKDIGTAIQTPENNSLIGIYLRNRLGIPSEAPITKEDIVRYGRSDIDFYKVDDMNYRMDFSIGTPIEQKQKSPNKPLQQIFYGAPGTGKSFAIDCMTVDERTVRTTFHPDSDYASFVGAFKPTMEDVPMSVFVGTNVHPAIPQGGHTGKERKIVYKYVPQAFLKAYVAAWKDLGHDYYLVIEEINRGNCAQVFGDLFQLLDRNSMGCSSYAIHADDDIRQFLSTDKNGFASLTDEQRRAIAEFVLVKDNGQRQGVGRKILSGELLLLPPNLRIWATMNTSDQSLFPVDSAFKRRWDWMYMPIKYNPVDTRTQRPLHWRFQIGENVYSWGLFLGKINPEIYALTGSEDKQMGYFFAKADPTTGIISQDVFLNKVLFYLWTDVFKDFDVSSELFKNKKANRSFRFTDFFEDEETLENFIANFNLEPGEIEPVNVADEIKQGRLSPHHSMTVTFPNGEVIHQSGIFETYRAVLEKVGIERCAEYAKTSSVKRQGYPIIDTEPRQQLLKNGYKYEAFGKYYLLSRIKFVSYRKFLKELSKDFGLNITITLE